MIERLTPEQEALMTTVSDEWLERVFGCAPLDRAAAEKGIKWLYRQSRLAAPRIVYADSPLGAVMTALAMTEPKGRAVGGTVRDTVWDTVWDTVGWGDLLGDAGFSAWADYWTRIGVVRGQEAAQYLDWIRSNVWWSMLFEHVCIVAGAPEWVRRDPQGRLHCADGPVMRWSDGFSIYSWHGVRLDGEIGRRITEDPRSLTRDEIMGIRNAEVARAVSERLGSDRYCELLDLAEEATDRWGHPEVPEEEWEEATLLAMRAPHPATGERHKYVRVKCPTTGRLYHLSVPPTVRTPREAVAWTMGIEPGQYLPLSHT